MINIKTIKTKFESISNVDLSGMTDQEKIDFIENVEGYNHKYIGIMVEYVEINGEKYYIMGKSWRGKWYSDNF